MTPKQIAFIEQRRRQIRYWPWMAAVLVALLLAAYAWLWRAAPINLNPELVLEQFHARTLGDEELILLAARGTLALAGCGLFMLVLVFLISLSLWNERRLISMIDALRPAPEAGAAVAAEPLEAAIPPEEEQVPAPAAPGQDD
ncbi:MAG: hypothetical protein K0Q68_2125 [Moraxellaceae bacterium]|jgi:hypothetical protein|nr:hypothetical protein [Moraxellaceae bacterium]